jgi:hypothetical protein
MMPNHELFEMRGRTDARSHITRFLSKESRDIAIVIRSKETHILASDPVECFGEDTARISDFCALLFLSRQAVYPLR